MYPNHGYPPEPPRTFSQPGLIPLLGSTVALANAPMAGAGRLLKRVVETSMWGVDPHAGHCCPPPHPPCRPTGCCQASACVQCFYIECRPAC